MQAVIVEQTPHKFAFFSKGKEGYGERLAGQAVVGAAYHGGILELDFDADMLYFFDGACPRYFAPEEAPKKHQLLVEFTDGSGFSVSVQMYGGLYLEKRNACDHVHYRTALAKPNPLGDAFTYEYFRGLYKDTGKKMSVKAFLATEQRIPGVGNGVLQDVLWRAKLNPRADMKTVTEAEFAALYDALRSTLSEMAALGGRSTERDFFGKRGGYAPVLCKDTLSMPCPRCGGTIVKEAYMGGAVYFCPDCQRR